MALQLNIWKAPNGFARIYINGLRPKGKVWLQAGRGRTTVHFEQGTNAMPEAEVLALVGEAAKCDPLNWSQLLEQVEAMPPEARPKGRRPGQTASSRRGDGSFPERWTPADALDLDPNTMTHPLQTPTTIRVDDREPAELVDRLRKVKNLNVVVGTLDVGDIALPDKFLIERKTARDFAASVTEDAKRMFFQSDKVAASGMRGILIIEGDLYSQTNMSLASITGTLSYLSYIQGIAILPTLSLEHTAYTIAKLIRHAVDGLGYDLGLRGSGPRDPKAAAAFVLEGLPGVSATTAKALLARFGSVQAIANASIDELQQVAGVGPKRAADIFATFRTA